MTPHIEAEKGDYHQTVLMPGDPLRAAWIANNFLSNEQQVNGVRNCLGFTGTYKGKNVSVQASGMGHSSIGIYAHELYNFYDVENIIRVGSCGGISGSVKKGDIVVIESTVYPGVTEEFVAPIIEKKSGLIRKKDFNVAYSPERINPGDTKY